MTRHANINVTNKNIWPHACDFTDKTPLGGILRDTKYGWLALGPKFCVVDLRSGLKIAARTFGSGIR